LNFVQILVVSYIIYNKVESTRDMNDYSRNFIYPLQQQPKFNTTLNFTDINDLAIGSYFIENNPTYSKFIFSYEYYVKHGSIAKIYPKVEDYGNITKQVMEIELIDVALVAPPSTYQIGFVFNHDGKCIFKTSSSKISQHANGEYIFSSTPIFAGNKKFN
jgi:hypothetical protein